MNASDIHRLAKVALLPARLAASGLAPACPTSEPVAAAAAQ